MAVLFTSLYHNRTKKFSSGQEDLGVAMALWLVSFRLDYLLLKLTYLDRVPNLIVKHTNSRLSIHLYLYLFLSELACL